MLKIRLQRVGRKHEPAFRLVLTDSKNATRSGKFKEVLGSYDPRKTDETINGDRVKYWLSVGAGATDTVHNLLVSKKIIDAKKVNVLPKKTYTPEPVAEVVPVAKSPETPVAEAQAPEVAEDVVTEEAPVQVESTDESTPEPEAEVVLDESVQTTPESGKIE